MHESHIKIIGLSKFVELTCEEAEKYSEIFRTTWDSNPTYYLGKIVKNSEIGFDGVLIAIQAFGYGNWLMLNNRIYVPMFTEHIELILCKSVNDRINDNVLKEIKDSIKDMDMLLSNS